jgi:hypothetical protein
MKRPSNCQNSDDYLARRRAPSDDTATDGNKEAQREPLDDLSKEFLRLYGHPQLWWFKR